MLWTNTQWPAWYQTSVQPLLREHTEEESWAVVTGKNTSDLWSCLAQPPPQLSSPTALNPQEAEDGLRAAAEYPLKNSGRFASWCPSCFVISAFSVLFPDWAENGCWYFWSKFKAIWKWIHNVYRRETRSSEAQVQKQNDWASRGSQKTLVLCSTWPKVKCFTPKPKLDDIQFSLKSWAQ